MLSEFIPLFVAVALAIGLAISLVLIAEKLGPIRPRRVKASPYESGMDPVGSARERYSIKFYLVGMIFIIFDVEIVFLYPWAMSFRHFLNAGAALPSLAVIGVFLLILVIGLVYDIKKGGLEWN